jgi:hypothetical protein
VGIEFPGVSNSKPGGRTRFGVTPPPTLAELAPGEIAVSTPAVLQTGSDGAAPPTDPDSALALMTGSARVAPVGRLGVFWETYGIAAGDSVEFAVWIERYTRQGITRRFTNFLGVTPDPNTPIVISWWEGPGARTAHRIDGPVAIAARSVSVDVSNLPSGSYWLSIAAKPAGREAVRSRTEIVVR